MQENITPKQHPKASAVQAIMDVECTLVERLAVLEILIRVADDLSEQYDQGTDCRALNGLSFLLRETSKALHSSIETLEFASREVRACHAC